MSTVFQKMPTWIKNTNQFQFLHMIFFKLTFEYRQAFFFVEITVLLKPLEFSIASKPR